MSLIYFAEFSDENVRIGEDLLSACPKSKCILWKNKALVKSRTDFDSIIHNSSLEDFYIIEFPPGHEHFFTAIASFINGQTFEPENIIIRGCLHEIWPIHLIKKSVLIDTKCYLILDNIRYPLESYEKEVLDSFDIIFSMGPSCSISNHSNKIVEIFKEHESVYFYKLPEYLLNLERVQEPIIVCNSNNFKEMKEFVNKDIIKDKKISVIDISECDGNELCVYLNIVPYVINETGSEEFDLLLKKMDRKSVSITEFLNTSEEEFYFDYEGKNLEEFSKVFVEIITDNLNSNEGISKQGNLIVGSEIS